MYGAAVSVYMIVRVRREREGGMEGQRYTNEGTISIQSCNQCWKWPMTHFYMYPKAHKYLYHVNIIRDSTQA